MDKIKYIKLSFIASIFVLIIFFIFSQTMLPKEKENINFQCDELVSEMEQILDNGERVSVEVPGKVSAELGEVVKFATILPDDIEENQVLVLRTIWQDVKIYIDNELRAEYSTKNTRPFGKNRCGKGSSILSVF